MAENQSSVTPEPSGPPASDRVELSESVTGSRGIHIMPQVQLPDGYEPPSAVVGVPGPVNMAPAPPAVEAPTGGGDSAE